MGSLNSPGIPIVTKQLVSHRSLGRNIAVTSGINPYGHESRRGPIESGCDEYSRSLALYGTQSTPAIDSVVSEGRFIKQYRSDEDAVVSRDLGQVPLTSGNNPEINLKPVSQRHAAHRGNRVVVQDSSDDTLVEREQNTSVRP